MIEIDTSALESRLDELSDKIDEMGDRSADDVAAWIDEVLERLRAIERKLGMGDQPGRPGLAEPPPHWRSVLPDGRCGRCGPQAGAES